MKGQYQHPELIVWVGVPIVGIGLFCAFIFCRWHHWISKFKRELAGALLHYG